MSLTLNGRTELRTMRTRNPEAAQKAQSKFHRRFFARHPHACRACPLTYMLAWILFFVFRRRPWWKAELHHRTMRHKPGTEPDKVGCPLCQKHHGRSDALRRKWEGPDGNQYRLLVTRHRLWLLRRWLLWVPIWVLVGFTAWHIAAFLAAHVVITIHWR